MADRNPHAAPASNGQPRAPGPAVPATAKPGNAGGGGGDPAARLEAPVSKGPRRSPTTGHVRRRHQTPEPPLQKQAAKEEDTTTESEDGGRPRKTHKRVTKQAAARSQSSPGEERPAFQRISTSEDEDDYWHTYFAVQSKNIAKHNGNSLTAAAAGVLRPGPARSPAPSPARSPAPSPAGAAQDAEHAARDRKKTDSTINRKSTAAKALADRRPSAPNLTTVTDPDRRRPSAPNLSVEADPDQRRPSAPNLSVEADADRRRPSAPNFSAVGDGDPLPPTPKPMLRRRAVRSKSKGPLDEPAASDTSSSTSKADKSIVWKKWSQAPEPSKKEVLSIDPSEVLRGLVPDDDLPTTADNAQQQQNGGVSRKSSAKDKAREKDKEGGKVSKTDLARKSSLRKERPKQTPASEESQPKPEQPKKPSWWSRLFGRKEKAEPVKVTAKATPARPKERVNWLLVVRDLHIEWRSFRDSHPGECLRLRLMWNRCVASLLLLLLYCGLGGLLFRFIEGTFESFYKCGVKRVKRDFIDTLWTSSHNLREDEWKSRARRRLWEFEEQLHAAHEAGVTSYSGIKSWSFLNAVVYCLTVVTTIGYGHISPSTNTGRAVTIIYAIFGIPMFLILLADFGKLFTRGIKFVWSFVRRLYYTGSCRKVRRTQPVQEMLKGAQMVYDLATFRRPSMFPQGEPADRDVEEADTPLQHQQQPPAFRREPPDSSEPPATPAPSAFEVDDEFNLPISVAIVILLIYLFVGASIYYIWESWGFFESFYFVFISMSTIGFGDFVPQHPMYMMASIVYLVFGLALTSMCINVVQEKLSDSFRQASAKIGATIGLRIAEGEAASTNPETPNTPGQEDDGEEHHGEEHHGQHLSPKDAREVPS